MKVETDLSCGDKVWAFRRGRCIQYTIGQVRFEYTESRGLGDGEYMQGEVIVNDGENYAPMSAKIEERYMCIETGIGSGSIHELGKTIFLTKEACEIASAEEIKRIAEAEAYRNQREREELLRKESYYRDELARIEAIIKATGSTK